MKTLLALVIIFGSVQMFAEETISFSDITTRGTACPQGSVSVITSPDGSTASFMFDDFEVKVPQTDGVNDNEEAGALDEGPEKKNDSSVSMKLCNLIFAANLPAKQKAVRMEISFDFRGYTYLDKGMRSNFRSVLFQKKGLGVVDENKKMILEDRIFKAQAGVIDENLLFSSSKIIDLNSKCGNLKKNKILFNLKNVIGVKPLKKNKNEAAIGQMTIDSADMVMHVKVITTTCN